MANAMDVARFFVNLFKDTEEGITNLKLQKLLYYSQGASYQRFGVPMFDDEIEAWDKGPVVYDVYKKYQSYQRDPIRNSEEVRFDEARERLLLDVAREYGRYTSSALVSKTHAPGTPWKQVYVEGGMRVVIPKDIIEDYFKNVEKPIGQFNIEDCFSDNDYRVVGRDTVIPLSEWDYE